MMKYTILLPCLFATGVVLHLLIVNTTGYFALPADFDTILSSRDTLSAIPSIGKSTDSLQDISNRTLGFQEIFVISLPERTDKRDAIGLQASVTDLSLTYETGVYGADVLAEAKPYGMHRSPGEVGAWRSHLNILQKMVHNQISSALVFEDDADWDVALKAQMRQFALGSRWLLNNTDGKALHSPYGDGWDVLWIGHCSIHSHKSDKRRWVIRNDPTVSPPGFRGSMLQPYDLSYWETGPRGDNHTRIVFTAGYGFCFAGWAISLAGAEKILYQLSMRPFSEPVDNGLGDMCKDGTYNITCIAPFPNIVGVSKPAGEIARGSDIGAEGTNRGNSYVRRDNSNTKSRIREKAVSERVAFSTRLNIGRLLNGSTEFESVYPDFTGSLLSLEEIGSAEGHGEYVGELPKLAT
jgi:GR25 family glycosyltransferase involved in LPS biosynthesis